ncbi:MAG: MBOAT family protein, partial [Verrucomicrobia bacterium]|nr:MBOAT family protein [Verrucomicrobiota bacterium]
MFLLLASCVFYVCWDWKTLPLIVLTAFLTWLCGLGIHKARQTGTAKGTHWYQSKAGLISAVNIILNLGILCVFKYYNFFAQSFADAFQIFGIHLGYTTLHLILPLGISYYTFRAISYSIDVYRGQMEPTRDFLAFFAFIIFFPLLLAGPIERARTMLGDFLRKRAFDKDLAVDGLRQILWGLFKKVVIADNCGQFVDKCF